MKKSELDDICRFIRRKFTRNNYNKMNGYTKCRLVSILKAYKLDDKKEEKNDI